MIIIWLLCYLALALVLIVPFRISSAESRREEREARR